MNDRNKSVLLVIVATLCWSSESLWVRLVSANDWQILFWSGGIMALALGIVLGIQYRGGFFAALRDTGRPGAIAAVSLALAYSSFIFALNRTTVAHTVVLLATAPLFAAILARLFLGEQVRRRTMIAMAIAFTGILVMVSDSRGQDWLEGDLFALATGAIYAVNLVALRAAPVRGGKPVDMMPSMAVAGLMIAGAAWFQADVFAVTRGDLGILVMIGLISMALGAWLFVRGVRHLLAAEAGLLCLMEVVIGPLLVWMVLDETPSRLAFAGGAIVLAALVLEALPGRRTPAPMEAK